MHNLFFLSGFLKERQHPNRSYAILTHETEFGDSLLPGAYFRRFQTG